MIGTNEVAKAPADGYTFLVGNHAVLSMLPHLQKIPYDPVKSFTPVFLAVTVPNILVVHPSVPAKDVKELIAYAKANPGKLTYASQGVGASGHIAGELFKLNAGVDITHVPYKGAAPAAQDLAAGHVSMMFDVVSLALGPIHAGRVRPLAVATKQRVGVLPDVPTMTEQGSPVEVGAWFGFLAPAGTPPAAIAFLNREANKVFSTAGRPRSLRQAGRGGAAPLHRCVRQVHAGRVRPLRRRDPQGRDQDGIARSIEDNHAGRGARSRQACMLAATAGGLAGARRRTIRRGRSGCWCRRRRAASATSCRASSAPKLAETGNHTWSSRTAPAAPAWSRPKRRRQGAARRLPAADGQSGPALDPAATHQGALRSREGFRADRADGTVPNILVVHPSVPAQNAPGADRLGQGEPRQADLCVAGHRRVRPHRRRTPQARRRRRHHPCAVPRARRPPRRTSPPGTSA